MYQSSGVEANAKEMLPQSQLYQPLSYYSLLSDFSLRKGHFQILCMCVFRDFVVLKLKQILKEFINI